MTKKAFFVTISALGPCKDGFFGGNCENGRIYFCSDIRPVNLHPLKIGVHYEKKLTKNIRPTDILLVFSKCSQIY